MNNVIYVGERASFKSTLALQRFAEDPENSLLVLPNMFILKTTKDIAVNEYEISDKHLSRIVSAMDSSVCGLSCKTIILDEFFMVDEMIAKSVFMSLYPIIQAREGQMIIYTSLTNDMIDSHRQDLAITQMKFNGWKVIQLKGGEKKDKKEFTSWLFGTKASEI